MDYYFNTMGTFFLFLGEEGKKEKGDRRKKGAVHKSDK